MNDKKKDIVNIAKHYPTELVGLNGWTEIIEAVKKKRRMKKNE